MEVDKKNVGIVYGGKSAEHEVSIRSATSIFKNIDRDLFNTTLIYIDRQGKWSFVNEDNIKTPEKDSAKKGDFIPWGSNIYYSEKIDIYFPVLHGPNGEDGRLQGIFEMAGVPFVGAGSLSSNIAMDKAISKKLFTEAGLQVPDYHVFSKNDPDYISNVVADSFNYPCFIKPCALGSSVGISRAKNKTELLKGISEAFKYDTKIIIEKEIKGMEYEVSVKGNENPTASKSGSFIPSGDFYDYEDKYILGKTKFQIPSDLHIKMEKELQESALIAYKALYLNGFSRVDFFIEEETDRIIINEINTIPGFTKISMFPKLWETCGITFESLITELIELGFKHFEKSRGKINIPE